MLSSGVTGATPGFWDDEAMFSCTIVYVASRSQIGVEDILKKQVSRLSLKRDTTRMRLVLKSKATG